MHTREETDDITLTEISRIVCKISELNDSLIGLSLSDKEMDYAIGDFHSAVEDAISELNAKFNGGDIGDGLFRNCRKSY